VTEPAHAVFLSYASQDQEAAQRICEALRAAGIEVWLDQNELRGGDAWDESIREQIKACALFIPVISANTHSRVEGYFRLEWKLAVDRSHRMAPKQPFLLPVVIDDTSQSDDAIPDRFRELQWSRLPGGQTTAAFVERVQRLLSPIGSVKPTDAAVGAGLEVRNGSEGTVALASRGPSLRPALLVAVLILFGCVAFIAMRQFVLPKHAAPSSSVGGKSITVLPFVDMSDKHDQEYFGDGMAEEILNLLVKIPDLKVIGRTSSFQFKGKTEDLRKVGMALGAAYLVEGSVRRSGDHIRVTAQLIDTRDGTHRWSETYDREASDTLKVQDEIATGLVRALQLEVASSGLLQGRVLPKSGEVYDTYLRGLHALNRFDQPGMNEAVAHFRHALTLDPLFVPAAEQLARTLCAQLAWGFLPPGTGSEQARAAADAALKLDPNSAVAHAVLGCVHVWYEWDWQAAQQEMNTAMALNPNDPFVLVVAAEQRISIGQWAEAVSLCDAALSTDPLYATVYDSSVWAYVNLGRLTEAEHALHRVLEISPTFEGAHHDLGVILLLQQRPQEALTEMRKETPLGGQAAGLVLSYHALRLDQQADEELTRLESEHAADMPMYIAEAYAFRGEKDQAFTWLDRAYAQKDILLSTIKGDPLLKNIRADPRYKAFLSKMNLPE
jgi:TolB-like protein/Tfp pilus assembly protein PilF